MSLYDELEHDLAPVSVGMSGGEPSVEHFGNEDVIVFTDDESKIQSMPFVDSIYPRITTAIEQNAFNWETDKFFQTLLPNAYGTRISYVLLRPEDSQYHRLRVAHDIFVDHTGKQLTIYLHDTEEKLATEFIDALLSAAYAKDFKMPKYVSKKKKTPSLESIKIINASLDIAKDIRRSQVAAKANNIARYLSALPTNILTPKVYTQLVLEMSSTMGWKMVPYSIDKLQEMNAGAFLAVAQGSTRNDAAIIKLSYRPATPTGGTTERESPVVALVGKGICFDTGGLNIKDYTNMFSMNGDMGGSAVALATLYALTALKVPFDVDCWLAIAENDIGPDAYKQSGVVTSASGRTIEVVHTDAEGRMALADALWFASETQPRLIMDFATLTGSMVNAIGTHYSGAFTNREDKYFDLILQAGDESGERVWVFPYDDTYDEAIESTIADTKQCAMGDDDLADHILAARFLGHFVGDCNWIHVDLSAAEVRGGLGHIPSKHTGFGVRFALSLLLDKSLW